MATLFAAVLAVDVLLLRAQDRAVRLISDRLQPARDLNAELLSALNDQASSGRGFLITGDDEFLAAFGQAGSAIDGTVVALTALLEGEPPLVAGVERAAAAVAAWQDRGAALEIRAKQAGQEADVVRLVRAGTARVLFEEAQAEITSLRDALIQRLRAAEDRSEALRRWLTGALLASALLGLGTVTAGVVLLRLGVERPLGRLLRAVSSVAEGDLDQRVPAGGPPELAELGSAVEDLRRRMLLELDDAVRARHALADRGLVVLSLSEELAPASLHVDGIRLAVRFRPVTGLVAGDWYHAFPVDDEHAAVVLVDVSGHGAEAGIFALRTKELLTAALTMGLGPGDAFGWLADRLGDTGDRFLTGVIAVLHTGTGEVRYANAGHPPMLVGGAGESLVLEPTGPLVGLPGSVWETVHLHLDPDHYLFAGSDGLFEAKDPDGAEFGMERLRAVVGAAEDPDPEAVADACLEAVDAHQVGPPRDDMTLVVFARDSRRETRTGAAAPVEIEASPPPDAHPVCGVTPPR